MPVDYLVIRSVALPIWIDITATFLFSITGAIIAIRRHYDYVGVFVLAVVTGLGGGLLRDGLFIQAGPPVAMRNGYYILSVFAGSLVAICFSGRVERLPQLVLKPYLLLDALGTGAYGVVGASMAWEAGLAIAACIFVGVVNAVGSGLIRDVLVREEPLLFKPGQFYVIASALGVIAFTVLAVILHAAVVPSALGGIAITFVIRLLAIMFDWQTRSVMRPM
jgi:uncharacterized membrane protein YeiH